VNTSGSDWRTAVSHRLIEPLGIILFCIQAFIKFKQPTFLFRKVPSRVRVLKRSLEVIDRTLSEVCNGIANMAWQTEQVRRIYVRVCLAEPHVITSCGHVRVLDLHVALPA
ncbi:MAG: hypothetical protein ACSHW6_02695, partial [Sulfitobacter geojensis]